MKLQHNQPDPLSIRLLTPDRIPYHFKMLQENKELFDDFTVFDDVEDLYDFVFSDRSITFEIGDGVGLLTLLVDGTNAHVQYVMYDLKFRLDVVERIKSLAFETLGLTRLTITVTEDRGKTRDWVLALGVHHEGRIRQCFHRGGKYLDVDIYRLEGAQ